MATPGDPFDTKALDTLRSEQRALLRFMPDEYLQHLADNYDPFPTQSAPERDRPLVELGLRQLAEKLRQEVGDEVCEQWRAHATATVVDRFLSSVGAPHPLLMAVEWPERSELDNKQLRAAQQLAAVLAWADAMASDGYRAPRLGEQPQFRADFGE